MSRLRTAAGVESTEVAVLGAGFGGLVLAHRLACSGIDDVVILERAGGVGGTWRDNSYPGAACDVPSHLYSLSLAPNPDWSRTYATQPEILAYIESCYDAFDVRRKVRCDTEIVGLTWLGDQARWRLVDRDGRELLARVVVSAVGMFHTPSVPDLPGLDGFAGAAFHSARWDHGHDLTGERVAVVGTGASAIQVVPAIADRVAHLDLYQRTPAWILPRKDDPFTDEQRRAFAADPTALRAVRDQLHDLYEQNTSFLLGDPVAELIEGMARSHLDRAVPDPDLRSRLTPDYPIGGKRVLLSSDFYPAVQRDDVELVTDPIELVTPHGIRTRGGVERPCDAIVLSTGFRATEYLRGIEVVGRDGLEIHDHWAGTPRAYHGMAVPGFPNLFLLYGPNTNQGGNSILLILEAQAQFVGSALEHLRGCGAAVAEVRPEAMARYQAELLADLAGTVWQSCDSYFRTDSGDVVTQLPHTAGWYRERTERFDPADFHLTPTPAATRGG